MNGNDSDREWARRLSALPKEVSPARDPWPDIASRISPHRAGVSTHRATPRAGRPWWPLAAAAALVSGVGVMWWMNAYTVTWKVPWKVRHCRAGCQPMPDRCKRPTRSTVLHCGSSKRCSVSS